MKALAHKRDDRYATAADMAADLEEAVEDLGLKGSLRDAGKLIEQFFAGDRAKIKQPRRGAREREPRRRRRASTREPADERLGAEAAALRRSPDDGDRLSTAPGASREGGSAPRSGAAQEPRRAALGGRALAPVDAHGGHGLLPPGGAAARGPRARHRDRSPPASSARPWPSRSSPPAAARRHAPPPAPAAPPTAPAAPKVHTIMIDSMPAGRRRPRGRQGARQDADDAGPRPDGPHAAQARHVARRLHAPHLHPHARRRAHPGAARSAIPATPEKAAAEKPAESRPWRGPSPTPPRAPAVAGGQAHGAVRHQHGPLNPAVCSSVPSTCDPIQRHLPRLALALALRLLRRRRARRRRRRRGRAPVPDRRRALPQGRVPRRARALPRLEPPRPQPQRRLQHRPHVRADGALRRRAPLLHRRARARRRTRRQIADINAAIAAHRAARGRARGRDRRRPAPPSTSTARTSARAAARPRALALPPGRYRVIAELDGYEPATSRAGRGQAGRARRACRSRSRASSARSHVDVDGRARRRGARSTTSAAPAACAAPCDASRRRPGAHLLYFSARGLLRPRRGRSTWSRAATVTVAAQLSPLTGSLVVSADERGAVVEHRRQAAWASRPR